MLSVPKSGQIPYYGTDKNGAGAKKAAEPLYFHYLVYKQMFCGCICAYFYFCAHWSSIVTRK